MISWCIYYNISSFRVPNFERTIAGDSSFLAYFEVSAKMGVGITSTSDWSGPLDWNTLMVSFQYKRFTAFFGDFSFSSIVLSHLFKWLHENKTLLILSSHDTKFAM